MISTEKTNSPKKKKKNKEYLQIFFIAKLQ